MMSFVSKNLISSLLSEFTAHTFLFEREISLKIKNILYQDLRIAVENRTIQGLENDIIVQTPFDYDPSTLKNYQKLLFFWK